MYTHTHTQTKLLNSNLTFFHLGYELTETNVYLVSKEKFEMPKCYQNDKLSFKKASSDLILFNFY